MVLSFWLDILFYELTRKNWCRYNGYTLICQSIRGYLMLEIDWPADVKSKKKTETNDSWLDFGFLTRKSIPALPSGL